MMVFLANARTLAMSHARARIPMIRFRYGHNKVAAGQQAAHQVLTQQNVQQTSRPQHSSSVALDEFDLPQRFQRQLISDEEIEYINRGGPA